MIRADYHVHSSHSGDSTEKIDAHIRAALKNNLNYICFTDHMDLDYPETPAGHEDEACDFTLDVSTYHADVIKYQKMLLEGRFDSSLDYDSFNLMYGIEIGLQPQVATANSEIIKSNNFDFVIGSVHIFDASDPYYPEFWINRQDSDIYGRYFESIYENICLFDDYDVVGHIDYIFRYGHEKDLNFKYKDFSDELDSILKKVIESGKGIEINTGGLRAGLKHPNPNPDILKRYKELGGEIITIGSDAHVKEHVSLNFDIAESTLKECGFKYYTVFKNRKPEFISF